VNQKKRQRRKSASMRAEMEEAGQVQERVRWGSASQPAGQPAEVPTHGARSEREPTRAPSFQAASSSQQDGDASGSPQAPDRKEGPLPS